MMDFSHSLLCLFVVLSLPTSVLSSANGLLYKCDTAKLAAEDMCYFVATGSETMGPHDIDRSVAEDGFRQVSDEAGSALKITPKPWTQGDKLTKSTELLADDLIAYANIFELVAPLRDAMMYDPKSVSTNAARWNELTKSLVDCKIKEQDTTMQKGGQTKTVYSVAGVYGVLKSAGGADTHHSILQFLEEGAIELVCVAVPSLQMVKDGNDHCEKVRKANDVTTEPSTCWHAAYKAMYGSDPATKPGATSGDDSKPQEPVTGDDDSKPQEPATGDDDSKPQTSSECHTLGLKLPTSIPDTNNLKDVCSAANLELFEDVVTKCTDTDEGSKAFAASAKQYKQLCSGGGTGGAISSGLGMVNCDQAPQGKKQACKDALEECMGKATEAEKKACWDSKADSIMNGAMPTADEICANAPQGMEQKCKDAIAKCLGTGTNAEKKVCVDGAKKEFMKGAMPTADKMCAEAPEGKKQKCKDAMTECLAKTNEAELQACVDDKVNAIMKETMPKKRKIAEKGTDCGKIPKKSELSKDKCMQLKEALRACASIAGLGEKIKKCAVLRNKKTRRIKRKLVRFAQKITGIDFSKDDEATKNKKAKYEKTVLKLFKAISGVFSYTKDNSRLRRKLNDGTSFTVNADLNTNSDTEADEAKTVDAAAISEELKTDADFQGVTVEASNVKVEEVDVEEEIEEEAPEETNTNNPEEGVGDTVSTTNTPEGPDSVTSDVASTTITFVFGLVSMMAF